MARRCLDGNMRRCRTCWAALALRASPGGRVCLGLGHPDQPAGGTPESCMAGPCTTRSYLPNGPAGSWRAAPRQRTAACHNSAMPPHSNAVPGQSGVSDPLIDIHSVQRPPHNDAVLTDPLHHSTRLLQRLTGPVRRTSHSSTPAAPTSCPQVRLLSYWLRDGGGSSFRATLRVTALDCRRRGGSLNGMRT